MKGPLLLLAAVVALLGIVAGVLLWAYSGARVSASTGWSDADCAWALATLETDRQLDQETAHKYSSLQDEKMATYYQEWSQRWFLAHNFAESKCGGSVSQQAVSADRIREWFRYSGQVHFYYAIVPGNGTGTEGLVWNLRWGLAYIRLQRIFGA